MVPRPILARAVVGATHVLTLVACPSISGGVASVNIDGSDRNVAVGGVRTLTATVIATGGASGAWTWSSSDGAVATLDAAGTALGVSVGTTDITATSVFDAAKSDTITLTVDPPGVARWTRQFGTGGSDAANGVATDASGDVYVAGRTSGALEGVNAGGDDAFVRAYGP